MDRKERLDHDDQRSRDPRSGPQFWIRRSVAWLFAAMMTVALAGCAPVDETCPTDGFADTRDGRWRADVACVATSVERLHPDPYTRVTQAEFRQAISALDRTVPQLTDAAIRVRLAAAVALLGDSNTRLRPDERPLAIEFERFPEGVYVVGARSSQQFLLGRRLTGLGSEPLDLIRPSLGALVAAENANSYAAQETRLLRSVDVMQGLGLAGNTGAVNVVTANAGGTTEETIVQPAGSDPQLVAWPSTRPRSLRRRGEAYWYEVDLAKQTVYFQYNRASGRTDLPMAEAADGVLRALSDGRASRLVLDMRFNDTGNAAALQPLLEVIAGWPGRRDPARFKLLVGPRTHAGALENAVRLSQTAAVEIIGEPPGGNPNHFGGVVPVALPESGLRLDVATQPVRLTQDPANRLRIDRLVRWPVADYARGFDPVLAAAGL